jgi:cbb3-type cytochrome oxidase subunit 3
MKKEALSQFGHPNLISLSFLLFFFCFLGVLVWALSKSNKSHFDKMARLPLVEENVGVKS